MSPRRAARVDTTQKDIVDGLREDGWQVLHLHVVGGGCPDLLISKTVAFVPRTALVECKSPGGSLRKAQVDFIVSWAGEVYVAYSWPELKAKLARNEWKYWGDRTQEEP